MIKVAKAALCILGMVALISFYVSCASNQAFINTSYKTLTVSRTTYDNTMLALVDMYRSGNLPSNALEKILVAGKVYSDAHNAAVEALARYVETKDLIEKDRIAEEIKIAAQALTEILNIAKPYLENRNERHTDSGPHRDDFKVRSEYSYNFA